MRRREIAQSSRRGSIPTPNGAREAADFAIAELVGDFGNGQDAILQQVMGQVAAVDIQQVAKAPAIAKQ
ncbi:hypothetical protein D3C71_2160850 [compost metagenome]